MRWFTTCVNQPEFLAVLGTTNMCGAGATPTAAPATKEEGGKKEDGGKKNKKEKAPKAPKEAKPKEEKKARRDGDARRGRD